MHTRLMWRDARAAWAAKPPIITRRTVVVAAVVLVVVAVRVVGRRVRVVAPVAWRVEEGKVGCE
jgi:hypothetical protein